MGMALQSRFLGVRVLLLLIDRLLEDDREERDGLGAFIEPLDLGEENARDAGGEADLGVVLPGLVVGIDALLLDLLTGVTTDCVGFATMMIPFEVDDELPGCIRLLPTFAELPLLMTMP